MAKNKFAGEKRINLLVKKNKFAVEKINLLTKQINLLKKTNKFADKNVNFAAEKE